MDEFEEALHIVGIRGIGLPCQLDIGELVRKRNAGSFPGEVGAQLLERQIGCSVVSQDAGGHYAVPVFVVGEDRKAAGSDSLHPEIVFGEIVAVCIENDSVRKSPLHEGRSAHAFL